MERIKLSEEIHLSRIIYGMWRLKDDPNLSHEHVQKKIHTCLEQGITTFDQADIYGDYSAEGILGAEWRMGKISEDGLHHTSTAACILARLRQR